MQLKVELSASLLPASPSLVRKPGCPRGPLFCCGQLWASPVLAHGTSPGTLPVSTCLIASVGDRLRVGVQNALYTPDGHPGVSQMVTRWSLSPSDGPMRRASLLGGGPARTDLLQCRACWRGGPQCPGQPRPGTPLCARVDVPGMVGVSEARVLPNRSGGASPLPSASGAFPGSSSSKAESPSRPPSCGHYPCHCRRGYCLCYPGGASGKESACQRRTCKRRGFHPWVGKIPWSRKWQPTPVLFPAESQGQRSLGAIVNWASESWT